MIQTEKKKEYIKYEFKDKGKFSSFETLKNKFNLQITIEQENNKYVYYYSDGIILAQQTREGWEYKNYERTNATIVPDSFASFVHKQFLRYATSQNTIAYSSKVLYSEI